MVKTTEVKFVNSKFLTTLTFLSVLILFSPKSTAITKPFCTDIPVNAHVVKAQIWECDRGYRSEGNSCVKNAITATSEVKGISTVGANLPSGLPLLIFLVGNAAGIGFLATNRSERSMW